MLRPLLFLLHVGQLLITVEGPIPIRNPSVLTSSSEIIPGTRLVINCSASAINVTRTANSVHRLQISRSPRGERPDQVPNPRYPLADFNPYFIVDRFKKITNIPPGRDWEVKFPEAPDIDITGRSLNNRDMNLELHIIDTVCADAGIYQCKVSYVDPDTGRLTGSGEQSLTAKGDVCNGAYREHVSVITGIGAATAVAVTITIFF